LIHRKNYYRYQRERCIERKLDILKKLHGTADSNKMYPLRGALSKGKIHCSCWICSKGSKSYTENSISDKRKFLKYQDFEQ